MAERKRKAEAIGWAHAMVREQTNPPEEGALGVSPVGLLSEPVGRRGSWSGEFLFEPQLYLLPQGLGPSAWYNLQWSPIGPEPVLNLSEAKQEGGFVSSKDTSKAKNYIAGRPKYACLEKLLAFMKSLVRKAGLQMTASERQ